MLGQPVYFLTPDVVGFEFTGRLREGVTATDLVLTVTEILRTREGGRQVRRVLRRRHREPVGSRPRDDGQHGARIRRDDGLLPGRRQDDRVLPAAPAARRARSSSSRPTSRRRACTACRAPARSTTARSSASTSAPVAPSLAGPKRPQDRIEIGHVKEQFTSLFSKSPTENGFNQPAAHLLTRHQVRAAEWRAPTTATPAQVPRTPSVQPGAPRFVEEMAANKPTLAAALHEAEPAQPPSGDLHDRQRRRADRGDHVVHQHLEPERA